MSLRRRRLRVRASSAAPNPHTCEAHRTHAEAAQPQQSCSGVHMTRACNRPWRAGWWRRYFEKNKRRGSTPAAAASLRRLLTALEFLDGVTNQSTCRRWFTTVINGLQYNAAMSAGHRLTAWVAACGCVHTWCVISEGVLGAMDDRLWHGPHRAHPDREALRLELVQPAHQCVPHGPAGSRHRTDKIGRCTDEIGRYPLKLAMIVAFSGSDWFSRKSRCASRASRT